MLGHVAALVLIFQGTGILISTAAAPFYMPTNSALGLPTLHVKRGVFKVGQIVARSRADGTILEKGEDRPRKAGDQDPEQQRGQSQSPSQPLAAPRPRSAARVQGGPGQALAYPGWRFLPSEHREVRRRPESEGT